jgi:hypothetical protein
VGVGRNADADSDVFTGRQSLKADSDRLERTGDLATAKILRLGITELLWNMQMLELDHGVSRRHASFVSVSR